MPNNVAQCFGRGTKVLMYDGHIKAVEDVEVGELLMGIDSKPRRVLSLARGTGELYRVVQNKGKSYIVNNAHILSLKMKSGAGRAGAGYADESVVSISVEQYLRASSAFKSFAAGWHVSVKFPEPHVPLPIPPYILGLWLCGGYEAKAAFETFDNEVSQALREYAFKNNLWITPSKKPKGRKYTLTVTSLPNQDTNVLLNDLKSLNVVSNKHVPHIYKTASVDDRLELLAGMIDIGARVESGGQNYGLWPDNQQLLNDIAFVARSLGFRCLAPSQYKDEYEVGNSRLCIGGFVKSIPCRVQEKRCGVKPPYRNPSLHGIKDIQHIGRGKYYGFMVDVDSLFLLDDFTVVHNSTKK